MDKSQYEKREKRYMQLIENYEHDEAQIFSELMDVLTKGLEANMTDLLGETFMELELGNDDAGQFFTPYSIAKLMADVTFSGVQERISERGYVGVHEPAVGGGVTIIALAAVLKEKGYNYQKCMKVICNDIDSKSVHMTYLQLSLLGIDATVLRGDTLTLEMHDQWITPMNLINQVKDHKSEKDSKVFDKMKQLSKTASHKKDGASKSDNAEMEQLSLF